MNSRMMVCYICGREFGSLSINIHTPKCLEKWRVENNKLPKSQRRSEPIMPQVLKDQPLGTGRPSPTELQRQNVAASATAKDAMLSTCDNCQRRFLPPQLIRHQKACRPGVTTFQQTPSARALQTRLKRVIIKKPLEQKLGPLVGSTIQSIDKKHGPIVKAASIQSPGLSTRQNTQNPSTSNKPAPNKQQMKSSGKKPPPPMKLSETNTPAVSSPTASTVTGKTASFSRPPSRVCYICGREFGTRSIDIHEPQCLEKWRVQNDKQPMESRRPEPQKPTGVQGNGVRLTKDQMNDLAYDTFKSNLAQCDNCGRRFLPDRLVVHLRSCKGKQQ